MVQCSQVVPAINVGRFCDVQDSGCGAGYDMDEFGFHTTIATVRDQTHEHEKQNMKNTVVSVSLSCEIQCSQKAQHNLLTQRFPCTEEVQVVLRQSELMDIRVLEYVLPWRCRVCPAETVAYIL